MSYMKRLIEDMVYVQVWLNEAPDGMNFLGYRDNHPLRLAAEYYVPVELVDSGTPHTVLNQAFEQLNIDYPTEEWAKQYRQNRNRSLSVGDVVVVGEQAYACASVGWQAVSLSSENCVR